MISAFARFFLVCLADSLSCHMLFTAMQRVIRTPEVVLLCAVSGRRPWPGQRLSSVLVG